jgi:hypothetical protein
MAACLSPGWAEGCARFAHPVFDPVRSALVQLAREHDWPDHRRLNALAAGAAPRTASGLPVRFVAPGAAGANYELRVHASGEVATRERNWHDLFNALAWLAFPLSKAKLNAIHASEIKRETRGRGPARDLLTIFDEGGALVACSDPYLIELIRGFRWQTLFWKERARVRAGMRILVFGHAVLEKALEPWPGITCKALLLAVEPALLGAPIAQLRATLDAAAAGWFEACARGGSPRDLAPLPIFGYPGWSGESEHPEFYADVRYFRPSPHPDSASGEYNRAGSRPGSRCRPLRRQAEESPGSAERDAG